MHLLNKNAAHPQRETVMRLKKRRPGEDAAEWQVGLSSLSLLASD